jgi:hypothetical protein
LPISIPASATRLAAAGLAATLLPIMKKVALAPASVNTFSNRSVKGVGPSSKVNATHLSTVQSTGRACAVLVDWLQPAITRPTRPRDNTRRSTA